MRVESSSLAMALAERASRRLCERGHVAGSIRSLTLSGSEISSTESPTRETYCADGPVGGGEKTKRRLRLTPSAGTDAPLRKGLGMG